MAEFNGKQRGTKLTPTEQRIFNALSDGKLHKRAALLKLLDDELAESPKALDFHISNLRRKLPEGVEIICQTLGRRGTFFRMIKRLVSPVW